MAIESQHYIQRGVSSKKDEVHQAIGKLDKGLFPGAFCKILPDSLTGSKDHCFVMHADGAGTKSSLAYIYWKETGDLSVFRDIAMDSLAMNLDDLACVGALDSLVLSNTIGRNRFYIPTEVIQAVIEGYDEALQMLREYNIDISLAGGETADVGDLVRTLIVDSTLVSRIKKEQVVDCAHISPGDIIIGFAGFGQSSWERKYNSGIGSNGLTAARHDLFFHEYAKKYPESYDANIPDNLVYCGSSSLKDPLPGTPLSIGQAVLSPTRTYAPLVKKLLDVFSGQVNGIIHCSGGGQTKCMKFGEQIHYIKDNLFPVPPLFQHIKASTGRSWKELAPVYNLGHRMEIFVSDPTVSDEIISMAKTMGIEAQIIGRCESSTDHSNALTLHVEGEEYQFKN